MIKLYFNLKEKKIMTIIISVIIILLPQQILLLLIYYNNNNNSNFKLNQLIGMAKNLYDRSIERELPIIHR